MSIVNTSPFLGPMGVWNFGDGEEEEVGHSYRMSAINIAGWFPVVNIISGIAAVILGVRCFREAESSDEKKFAAAIIARGILQICQLGFLFAPVDLVCSVIRSYRERKVSSSKSEF
jgi:hypothetical protein